MLDTPKKTIFDEMSAPQLDVDPGAVSDFSGNGIAAAQNDITIAISDTVRPAFESARYSTSDGVLSITFSENVTVGSSPSTVHTRYQLHDYTNGNISLGTDRSQLHTRQRRKRHADPIPEW